MSLAPEEELAEMLRHAYGGDARVELTDNGLNVWVRPASGGSIHARMGDVNSPILTAFLGVLLARGVIGSGD